MSFGQYRPPTVGNHTCAAVPITPKPSRRWPDLWNLLPWGENLPPTDNKVGKFRPKAPTNLRLVHMEAPECCAQVYHPGIADGYQIAYRYGVVTDLANSKYCHLNGISCGRNFKRGWFLLTQHCNDTALQRRTARSWCSKIAYNRPRCGRMCQVYIPW